MILNILVALFILGIVVFFHELGHFIFAKKVGIKVHTFSIGFGPRLWGFVKGGTDYRFSAIPFGGYVAMAGEEIADRKGEPEEFASKTVWERFQVVFAGPLMNFILAFLVIWVVLMIGVRESSDNGDVLVGWVQEASPAEDAGITAGARIISLNGKKVEGWTQFLNKIILSENKAVIEWAGPEGTVSESEFRLERDPFTGMVNLGIAPGNEALVSSVAPDSPAQKSGLMAGDRIVSVNGNKISCAEELVYHMGRLSPGEGDVTLGVARGEEALQIALEAAWDEENSRFVMGIDMTPPENTVLVRYNPLKALPKAFKKLFEMVGQMLLVLKLLFSRVIPVRSMGGAIGIVQMTSRYAELGVAALLQFVAFISINLGIVNLLPIPIADGGQIVFLGLEKAMRRPLSKKTMTVIMNIGWYFVILLLILTTYNDIIRLIKGVF